MNKVKGLLLLLGVGLLVFYITRSIYAPEATKIGRASCRERV